MSTIRNAMNNWLQKQGVSMMHQETTVCDAIPPHTKDAMVDISIKSTDKEREMGTPITQDYTLGKVLTGTRTQVPIPRPAGTIGTFHTHPFGWSKPSPQDAIDMINRDDKVMCIGASGKPGTKIQCFTPQEPQWSELRTKLRLLADDINDFNEKVGTKYQKRGVDLRKLLKEVRYEWLEEGITLEHRRRVLMDNLERQILYLGYQEEWRPQIRTDEGWEAKPIIMNSCKILWETLEGELPYEL